MTLRHSTGPSRKPSLHQALGQLETALRDARMQDFRLVPVQLENLPHKVANRFMPALIEYQHARTGAAQGAPQQAGSAQFQNLLRPGTSGMR